MSLNLTKGSSLNLTKAAPNLSNILIGCGWEKKVDPIDVDVSIFALSNGTVQPSHVIFFNQLETDDGSIKHMGDNRTGAGDGDDEVIKVDLNKLEAAHPEINELAIWVTIDKAKEQRLNFGSMKEAYCRIVNAADNKELCNYDLDASFNTSISVQMGSLIKIAPKTWEFKAVSVGYPDKCFIDVCGAYGVT